MKKKFMALLMAAVLVLGTSTTVFADIESPVVDNNKPEVNSPVVDNDKPESNEVIEGNLVFEYTDFVEGYGVISLADGVSVKEVVIPATCNGKAVTAIFNAFTNNKTITSVTIPTSVKMIGEYTFQNCSNLTKIIFSGVEYTTFEGFRKAFVANGGYFGSDAPEYFEFGGTGLVDIAGDKLDHALESEDPEAAKDVLITMPNETIVEIMKEDVTKVEQADNAWAEEKDIKVETKSEVESVDASKVTIVGAALNANGIDEKDVVLTITEPEKKVEVEKKYENAVALDIELVVAGESKDELDVPVSITMPIPEGVETKNLVVLHYHGDAEEPVVIVPTVNEDGTMTFVVSGFSTFVVANLAPVDVDVPGTGDRSGVVVVFCLVLIAAGVVLITKRNAFAK